VHIFNTHINSFRLYQVAQTKQMVTTEKVKFLLVFDDLNFE
jgi:hypothetical protein